MREGKESVGEEIVRGKLRTASESELFLGRLSTKIRNFTLTFRFFEFFILVFAKISMWIDKFYVFKGSKYLTNIIDC